MGDQRIGSSVFLLRCLAIAVIVVQVGEAVIFLAWEDMLYLEIDDEIWSQRFWDFPILERWVLFELFLLPLIIMVWAAYQLIQLCREFDRGGIFTSETVGRIHKFAVATLALAAAETLIFPIVVTFLDLRGALPGAPDISLLTLVGMVEFEIFMVGVLFFLIARVMRRGLEIQSEQELTI